MPRVPYGETSLGGLNALGFLFLGVSMNNGFIVIWRKFEDTSFYKDSYAVHLALHLIMRANHEPRNVLLNGNEIVINRGQCVCGRFSLAKETGMKPSTIRNKLALLKKLGFLDIKTNNKFSIVSICKYNDYQNKKEEKGQELGQPEDSQRTARGHKQQLNNDNNANNNIYSADLVNKTPIKDDVFNAVWLKYPKRVGKKSAYRHFKASVKTEQDVNNLWIALKHYLESKPVAQGFIQNGSTWFNNWQDWIDHQEKICSKCKGKGFYISSTGYEIQCDCGVKI